ncbi:MAG: hypothetical protein R3C97_12165 [Geminicoccaceae bacterium]
MALTRKSIGYFLLALMTLALGAATAVVFITMERYEIGEPAFIANPSFEQASDNLMFDEPIPPGWERLGTKGRVIFRGDEVVIENDRPGEAVGIEQVIELPPDVRAFEISGTIELALAVGGDKSWERARVDLVGIRANGSRDFSRPHKLFEAVGTRPAFTYHRIVEFAPDIAEARLSLRLAKTTGRMTLSGLELRPAIERAEFTQASLWVRSAWLGLLLVAGSWFIASAAHRPAAIAAVALVTIGGLFALMPYEIKEPFMDLISPVTDSADQSERAWTDRALHVVAFLALGFLVRLARRRDPVRKVAMPLVFVTLMSELLQSVTTGIGMDDLVDAGANLFGMIVGLGVGQDYVRKYYRRRRRSHRHRHKSRSHRHSRDKTDEDHEGGHEPGLADEPIHSR